jgi:RNA polymerase sigma factor (sigma-70 family)
MTRRRGNNPHLYEKLAPEHQERVDKLVADNRGLIGMIIKELFGSIPPSFHDDLFAEGLYSLWRAARVFDPLRGYKFSTLAVVFLRRDLISQRKFRAIRKEFTANDEQWKALTSAFSIQADFRDGSSDLLPAMHEALKKLPTEIKEVLVMKYLGDDKKTVSSIAAHFGISAENVGHLCTIGLKRLRYYLEQGNPQ